MTNWLADSLSLFSDSPNPANDLLDFARYANPLAELITDPHTQTPLTIGIYGRWGTGKTTLMHLVRKGLPSEDFLHVDFVPWLYGGEENLLVPLLHTIHDVLVQSVPERLKASVARIAEVTARIAASLTLKTLSVGQVGLNTVDEEIQHATRTPRASTIGQLRDELRKVASEITENGKTRLVIYVDDLDRCLPNKIIELLEGIKLFLDLPHTIFVLAVDLEIVEYGIRAHYKDFDFASDKLTSLTADYLDKMVQIPVFLHLLDESEMHTYLEALLHHSQLTLPENIKQLLATGLLPNPRKIKRVLNLLALHSLMASRRALEAPKVVLSILTRMVLIQQQWPELYARVRAYPKALSLLGQVVLSPQRLEIETNWLAPEAANPGIRQYCHRMVENLPPYVRATLITEGTPPINVFEDVDMRPYVQLLG